MADAFLVVGGFLGAASLFIPAIEPILSIFEPRGLSFIGYFLALLLMLAAGALGFWLFVRIERKLRWEVIIPRRVFAITSAPIIFILVYLTGPWVWKSGMGFFEHALLLVLALVPVYGLVLRLSLRFPERAAGVAIWFHLGLMGLGVFAKFATLFSKK